MATSIWKKISDVLGFTTAGKSVKSLFTGDGIGLLQTGFLPGMLSDYVNNIKSWDNNSDINSGVTESNVDNNSIVPSVDSGSGPLINEDGSSNLNNVTSLSELGVMGLEALAGGIPELQRQWNSAEALKERKWQTEMSNTAYQRSMNDMKAAGLNPILAYSQGGATSASGASASGMVSTGANLGTTLQGVSSILKTVLREDRKSDQDAFKAAQAATKLTNPSSAQTAYRNYITFKKNAR